MTSRAKPRFTSRRSNSQPTNQDSQSTDTVIQKWAGDQLSRTTWFNVMLKKAAQVFEWKQLVTSGTVCRKSRASCRLRFQRAHSSSIVF